MGMILTLIFIYVICALLFDLFMGWLISGLERINEQDLSHLRFTNLEKLLNIIIWPYNLFVFIYGFIMEAKEDNEE